jgi:hypothetical protein
MPRKRTHEAAARTQMITVRLTPEVYARISTEASRLGLSRAGYIHHLIESKKVEAAPADPDLLPVALINQLKRIGNNLNQIAHAVNGALPPSQHLTVTTLRDLITTIVDNELLARRQSVLNQRISANDSTPPSPGDQLQGHVRLHFARHGSR